MSGFFSEEFFAFFAAMSPSERAEYDARTRKVEMSILQDIGATQADIFAYATTGLFLTTEIRALMSGGPSAFTADDLMRWDAAHAKYQTLDDERSLAPKQ